MLLDAPAGMTIDLFGLAHAHASPSVMPDSARAKKTSATSGPSGAVSSASAALAQSLESRLRAKLLLTGSTMCKLTWKRRHTPLRRSICALRASARRTGDKDCGGWPTPTARDFRHANARAWAERNGGKKGEQLNNAVVHLACWATPAAAHARGAHGGGMRTDLRTQIHMATWPTPTATDAIKRGEVAPRPGMMGLSETAPLACWSTPLASDARGSAGVGKTELPNQAKEAGPARPD